jgi:hypothetical protein
MNEPSPSRRRFLVQTAVAATALPLLARMANNPALAADLKPLTDANPQAKALHYTDNAAASKDPAHTAGSACAGCQFFTASTGACALFAGYKVNPKGWCTAWAKKA